MTTFSHSSTTPSVSVTTAPGNNQSQLVATPVPDEQRISFWPQHFGLIPQWVTLEPRVFGWMDRLCEDYCGGIRECYLHNKALRIDSIVYFSFIPLHKVIWGFLWGLLIYPTQINHLKSKH